VKEYVVIVFSPLALRPYVVLESKWQMENRRLQPRELRYAAGTACH